MHFNISRYCKLFALKNLPDVTEVIYAWDDLFPGGKEMLELLTKTEKVILYSEFKHVSKQYHGWENQQFVKLQLHHYFDDDRYFIVDGDTLLRTQYRFDFQKPTVFTMDEYYAPYFHFIRNCLGLEKQNIFSFISPFFLFEKEVLTALEAYSIERNGCGVIEFYQTNKWSDYKPVAPFVPPFSECEIYGTFATQVLKKQYNFVENTDFLSTDITASKFLELFHTTTKNLVLHGTDYDITEKQWKKISSTL